MATCKENCIHYSVCGIWDRKVFVDYNNNILSDFSDLPNVEEHCRNYLSKQVEAQWKPYTEYYADDYSECNTRKVWACSRCGRLEKQKEPYCNCGAKMVGRR
jgi:hypothetical protein